MSMKTDHGEIPAADDRRRLSAVWRRAYTARSKDDLRRLYADWAATYDEDHAAIGFVGHELAARFLQKYVPMPRVQAVLDAGAGTGAAGVALAARGFGNVTAVDLSADMLEEARRKGVYRQLFEADLGEPLDCFPPDHFDAAILVGVFSYGQAPAHALDEVLRVVKPGGVIVFTAREDFMADDPMGVARRARRLGERGAWRLLERSEPAQYLPKKDPEARFRVWCYRVVKDDAAIAARAFHEAAHAALSAEGPVKRLDHAYIWNSTASRLYDRYTECPDYYLTDCEEAILEQHAAEIAGDDECIVELGCGSARKVRHLLSAAVAAVPARTVSYLPIDVSPGAIEATRAAVEEAFGASVAVEPHQGLFADVLARLPVDRRKVVLFFGSSLGNIETLDDTIDFLRALRDRLGRDDRLVVGLDLHKDPEILLRAYRAGSANLSFFVNMVRRINDNLGADFDPEAFEHASTYVEDPERADGLRSWRVDLAIATTRPQNVFVRELDLEVRLDTGHAIQVGISRKFRPEDIQRLAELAGLRVGRQWFDARRWFSLNEMRRDDARTP